MVEFVIQSKLVTVIEKWLSTILFDANNSVEFYTFYSLTFKKLNLFFYWLGKW